MAKFESTNNINKVDAALIIVISGKALSGNFFTYYIKSPGKVELSLSWIIETKISFYGYIQVF